MRITRHEIGLENKYVIAGTSFDTRNPAEYCAIRLEIGVTKRGLYKEGNLIVPSAKRPRLVIGMSQDAYLNDVKTLKWERKIIRRNKLKAALVAGGAASLVVGGVAIGVGAATAPVGAAMVGKGVAIGVAAGAALATLKMAGTAYEYKTAILFLQALNDMVVLMHTGEEPGWMEVPSEILKRRDANPFAFDQATAELEGLGVDVSWAERFDIPRRAVPRSELDLPVLGCALPPVPTGLLTFPGSRLVSPERGAA